MATRAYCSAINNNSWAVQTTQSHCCAWHIFIATNHRNYAIVPLCANDSFDTIGNHIAAHERVTHTFRSHTDAIAHANSVKTKPNQIRRIDRFFDFGSEIIEVHITRVAVPTCADDADLRLRHVFARKPNGVQHGLCRRLRRVLCNVFAVFIHSPP